MISSRSSVACTLAFRNVARSVLDFVPVTPATWILTGFGLSRLSRKNRLELQGNTPLPGNKIDLVQLHGLGLDIAVSHFEDILKQFLANLLDIVVERPAQTETTALGAAYLAGLQAGIFSSLQDIASRWQAQQEFDPAMNKNTRNLLLADWHEAVIKVKTHA